MENVIKGVCAFLLIIGVIATLFSWIIGNPNEAAWYIRIISPIVCLVTLTVILAYHFRKDIEPDHLRREFGNFLNRNGFCFLIIPSVDEGIAYLDAYFQSQYDHPCIGQIALRPPNAFYKNGPPFDVIYYHIECPPAGFGVSRIAVPIPKSLQGKIYDFEVGASVIYPHGRGKRIRFADGRCLRVNSKFVDGQKTALLAAAMISGTFIMSGTLVMRLQLPTDVANKLPEVIPPETRIFSQLTPAFPDPTFIT